MKKSLVALLMTVAGCSSTEWKKPEMNQKPIELAIKKESAPVLAQAYKTIELEVSYSFEDGIAANAFDGYILLLEKDKGKDFTDYDKMLVAFKVDKEGNISSNDIGNVIDAYAKEKGTKEIPFAEGSRDELTRKYNMNIAVTTDKIGEDLAKHINDKKESEKAKVAEAVLSVYGGQNTLPIGPQQLKEIKKYLN